MINWKCLAALTVFWVGCANERDQERPLMLATTTSTRDSGLLDELVPMFEAQTGIEVKVAAVGSGQALELGRRGDADVLLTHAPQAELEFVADGYAGNRYAVMSNSFVLVGTEDDPAGLRGQTSMTEALRQISAKRSPFISRGDESGTHMRERRIWEEAGVEPDGEWYVRAGAGMAEALRMASEMRAYTLSDSGTFLAHRERLELVAVIDVDPLLENPYSVMTVSPERHPKANHEAAARFARFLLSPAAQTRISEFGVKRFGQPLFSPVDRN